jgi:transcriptional regulator with XRE-family HTH domain
MVRLRSLVTLAGDQLKEIRSRLSITTRDVAELSLRIAEEEGNEEFQISNAWLTQIENSDSIPSIYKLYSLSVIYHLKFGDLLQLFGVDVQKIPRQQMMMPLQRTHLTPVEVFDEDRSVTFPIRFDSGFDLGKTNLISRMVEVWGEVPIALIQHLNIRNSLYGYIGLEDYSLYPLVRPGSFVQIDQNVRKIHPLRWRTEYDRPIYFIELRDGYSCSWCELQGSQLILIPHPLSPCSVRQFNYGKEAEIVGRVTGVAMRIVDPVDGAPDGNPRLPKQS